MEIVEHNWIDGELVCEKCLTADEAQAIYGGELADLERMQADAEADNGDLDPLVDIPRLVSDYEAKSISGREFEDRLVEQTILVEHLEEIDAEGAVAARALLRDAITKLPPESPGDMAARLWPAIDRAQEILGDDDAEVDDAR